VETAMAKIILAMGGVVIREMVLSKECITIGRSPYNDIVIDDCAVSAQHAVIVTVNSDSFLEDLNSTNGTQVNGQPVKKHFLRNGDVVELAGYKIAYVVTSVAENLESVVPSSVLLSPCVKRGNASITVINGPNAGKEIFLVKTLTTFGCPGTQVVAIARQAQIYYLRQVEGASETIVNGTPLKANKIEMTNGDIIDLCGIRMRFLFVSH
jgi:hypothetical protein